MILRKHRICLAENQGDVRSSFELRGCFDKWCSISLAEHDPRLGVQTPPRKSYNPFDSDDEGIDGYMRNNVNYDIKSFEKNADSLTFHLDTADLSWEEAILAHS